MDSCVLCHDRLTYYSFHDVKNAQQPLIKPPGSIKGQMFDIINCENSELVVLDHCEQVHIDHVNNCRIFVGVFSFLCIGMHNIEFTYSLHFRCFGKFNNTE